MKTGQDQRMASKFLVHIIMKVYHASALGAHQVHHGGQWAQGTIVKYAVYFLQVHVKSMDMRGPV